VAEETALYFNFSAVGRSDSDSRVAGGCACLRQLPIGDTPSNDDLKFSMSLFNVLSRMALCQRFNSRLW